MVEYEFAEDVFDEIVEQRRQLEEQQAAEAKRYQEVIRREQERMAASRKTDDQRAYEAAIDQFTYEIAKNKRNLDDWEETAQASPLLGAMLSEQISDAKRRIDNLTQRLAEIQEQGEQEAHEYGEDDEEDDDGRE